MLEKLIKDFAHEISIPLTYISSLSFRTGVFPSQWKSAMITPLEKKKFLVELGDLRQLSLPADIGKILEGFAASMILKDIAPNIDPL